MRNRNQRRRPCSHWARQILSLQAALLPAFGVAQAEFGAASWQVQPELYVTGISSISRADGRSTAYDTVAVTAELTFFSRKRPYWGGPFVDYRTSSSSPHADNLNIGIYGRFNLPRWDLTGWLFENRSPGNSGTWVYATRVRFRVTEKAKLGFETLAALKDASHPRIMLGYYGSMSDSLSLNILAGAGSGGTLDLAARVELVWKVR